MSPLMMSGYKFAIFKLIQPPIELPIKIISLEFEALMAVSASSNQCLNSRVIMSSILDSAIPSGS